MCVLSISLAVFVCLRECVCALNCTPRCCAQQVIALHRDTREYLLWKYCLTFIRNVHFVYLIGLSALCIYIDNTCTIAAAAATSSAAMCLCVLCVCVIVFSLSLYSQRISCSCSDNFVNGSFCCSLAVDANERGAMGKAKEQQRFVHRTTHTQREREKDICCVRVRLLLAILCLNLL